MQMFALAFPSFLPAVVLHALLQIRVFSSANQWHHFEFSNGDSVPKSSTCASPMALGMESGELPDDWLFASSSFHAYSLGPHNARIRSEKGGGAWCPREQIKADTYEFIQVDFPFSYEILGVEVQGRHANGSGREWAEALVIDFLRERWDGTNWTRYENDKKEEILLANRDQQSAVLIPLIPSLFAVSLRLVPFSSQLRTVCLRFELYGCSAKEGKGKAKSAGASSSSSSSSSSVFPLLLLLIPSSFVLFLLLLLLLFRAIRSFLRRAISSDQKGLFGSSSAGGSPPLLPSSSWQNIRLPFDTTNAKVFSPSFCRFDTLSLGCSLRSSPAAEEQPKNIYYAEEEGEEDEQMQRKNEVTRSRSLHAAALIGTPTKVSAQIPVRPVRLCQLAHSSSQPESFRAVTRPLCQRPKPVPKPRRTANFTEIN
ncbi:hypothetical protein niasHS_002131 [Heterodera schachtii]|uniref:F5/8 type C domain-containing protein n=1 Tax=Heterodera schachtii TaxID=97005 RepID=A0ABD2KMV5_HETSC